jgi:hypothetical protein
MLTINTLPKVPEFLVRTGDLTHLSNRAQFDTLAQVLKECRTKDVFMCLASTTSTITVHNTGNDSAKNTIGGGALRRIKSGGKGYFDKCNSSSRY